MNSSGDLELKNKKISEIAFTEISPHLPLNIAIVLKSSVEASRTHTHKISFHGSQGKFSKMHTVKQHMAGHS